MAKNRKKDDRPKAARPVGSGKLPPPLMPGNEATNTNTRPVESAYDIAQRIMESRAAREAEEQQLANKRLTLVFGDGTISVLDGLGRMIKRLPLQNGWTEEVAIIQAARNCLEVGCRISHHAHFSMFQMRRVKVNNQKALAGEPMIFTKQEEF